MTHLCGPQIEAIEGIPVRVRVAVAILGLGMLSLISPTPVASQTDIEARRLTARWVGVDFQDAPCRGGQGVALLDKMDSRDRERILAIEAAHFRPGTEFLPPDVGLEGTVYTLHSVPNHHRALYGVINYFTRSRKPLHPAMPKAECWLQRAMNFRPDDHVVRMLYGLYAHRLGRLKLAEEQYLEGLAVQENDAELHYNLGLLYVDLEDYDKARHHADRAYALGFQLMGLEHKLSNIP